MSPKLILLAVPFFLVTLLVEAWARKRRGLGFDTKDGATSVGMGFGFLLLNLALKGVTLGLFQIIYDHRILDLGDVAVIFVSELVHRQPTQWSEQIDGLHELLQTWGDGLLTLAIHMAVAERRFTVDAVRLHLTHGRAGSQGATPC